MPGCLDIYVLTRDRNRKTLERFVKLYVDRCASQDRQDEELMMLPLAATEAPEKLDEWDWEPSRDLDHIIDRALDQPRRAFAVYLTPSEPEHERAIIAFTADDQTVLGVSIDAEDGDDANLDRAKVILHTLADEFGAHSGFLAWEEPPPLSAGRVPQQHPTLYYVWERNA